MNNNSLPIIRLEIEGMRHNIVTALNEERAKYDDYVQKAVEEATKPENIKQVVEKEVYRTIDAVIKDEVKSFFSYSGEGRKMIARAVKEKLLSKDTFTPLDDIE